MLLSQMSLQCQALNWGLTHTVARECVMISGACGNWGVTNPCPLLEKRGNSICIIRAVADWSWKTQIGSRWLFASEIILGTIGNTAAEMTPDPNLQFVITIITGALMLSLLLYFTPKGKTPSLLSFCLVLAVFGVQFVAVPTGILKYEELRLTRTTENKLIFARPRIIKMRSSGNSTFVKLGCELKSVATFPVEYEVQGMYTSLGGKRLFKREDNEMGDTVQATQSVWIDGRTIQLDNLKKNSNMEGEVFLHLKYGRPGRLDQELILKKLVLIKINDKGDLIVETSYNL